MYEMPSAPPSHQPLPAIPLTETTPTGGDVGVVREGFSINLRELSEITGSPGQAGET